MTYRKQTIGLAVFIGLCLAMTPGVSADGGYGDFQKFLFRGTEYLGNHLFLSNPQGGPLYNYNQFAQRVEYNRAGGGYTYESYRFFGADSYGNPNTLDLGPFKIQISPDPNLIGSAQPGGIHTRVGYTTTLLPELFFEMSTGQRGYNQYSGISSFSAAPLSYTVSFNTGFQDFEWNGNVMITADGSLNALGFYDFDFRLTNVGSYEADGFVLQDEQVTDFDIGPISVSGHVVMDTVAAVLQANMRPGDAVPQRVISGAATKDKTQDLLSKMNAGEALTDEEINYLVQQMFLTAIEKDPIGFMQNGLPSEVEGFEGLSLSLDESQDEAAQTLAQTSLVPEPGTFGLLLVLVGGMAVAPSLRRRLR